MSMFCMFLVDFCVDSRFPDSLSGGSGPKSLGEPVMGGTGSTLSSHTNRFPLWTVRSPQASLLGELKLDGLKPTNFFILRCVPYYGSITFLECEKKNGNTCDECQCFLDVKTKFAIQQCPLEKWSLDEKSIEDEVSKMV